MRTKLTTVLSIPTINDQSLKPSGGITAKIQPGTGYTSADEPNNTATIAIMDNDIPVGVSIIPMTDVIEEGEVARFQLSVLKAEPFNRVISIRIDGTGSGLIAGSVPTSVYLPALSTTEILTLPTQIGDSEQTSGNVTVTIELSDDYQVANAPYNSASIYVQNQERPTLTIASELQVTEGDTAEFAITASQVSVDPLNINLAITEADDFLEELPDQVVVLDAGELTTTYTIPIIDNDIDTTNGQLTVKLLDGLNYQLDSDSITTASIIIEDNDLPEISITALEESVVEGQVIWFDLQATTASNYDLPVSVSMIQTVGDFLAEANSIRIETIKAGAVRKRFFQEAINDQVDEIAGQLTVQIEPSSQYTIVENQATSLVEVLDDDLPILSITTQPNITEGDEIEVVITSPSMVLEDLNVNLNITQIGNYIVEAVPNQITFPAQSDSTTLLVETVDNLIDEADGIVYLSLLAGEGI